jgi:hypothetical protein
MGYSGWYTGRQVEPQVGTVISPIRTISRGIEPDVLEEIITSRRPDTAGKTAPETATAPDSVDLLEQEAATLTRAKSAPSYLPEVRKQSIVGFSGWYRGRSAGKVGTVAVHRHPISSVDIREAFSHLPFATKDPCFLEPEAMSYDELDQIVRRAHADKLCTDTHIEDQKREQGEAVARKLISEIKAKLELQYPNRLKRHRHVKLAFRPRDRSNSGIISVEDFRLCLRNMNVDLPDLQFGYVCELLQRSSKPGVASTSTSGISYSDFMILVDAM